MKIGHIREEEVSRLPNGKDSPIFVPPGVRAVQLLLAWLEVVNQAGLDGKKLTDITIVEARDVAGRGGMVYELHAKVTHRLAGEAGGAS